MMRNLKDTVDTILPLPKNLKTTMLALAAIALTIFNIMYSATSDYEVKTLEKKEALEKRVAYESKFISAYDYKKYKEESQNPQATASSAPLPFEIEQEEQRLAQKQEIDIQQQILLAGM